MSEYGLKINIFQAGSIFERNNGARDYYDYRDGMLANSLFLDHMLAHGLTYKGDYTRDIICIDFDYGSSSYEEVTEKIGAVPKHPPQNYIKKSKEEIRTLFYTNGVDIIYTSRKESRTEKVHYRMLYRTPGKAKKGSCMFVNAALFKEARNYLYMGIELPFRNAKIVEVGAYSSLITSTIESRIQIKPENVLIINDVNSYSFEDVVNIDTDENRHCRATAVSNYRLSNTMFDGQALIDESIFPIWANGYILLRQHFTKCAAFCSRIQRFFQDRFGSDYESAELIDMWGGKHKAKDVLLITTSEACKWLKFDVSFEYWSDWVRENGSMWGIVKTAHGSKLGSVQRMSYQMVNALDNSIMRRVMEKSIEYVVELKSNDEVFKEYLSNNINFSNDFDMLLALCEDNPEFIRSEYFYERREQIVNTYIKNMKSGRLVQNADNLTIVGSPYAMLLAAAGDDPMSDPTFSVEGRCVQCHTGRFEAGDYLAAFRSPMNSQNNIDYLHNVYHEYFDKYFNFGKLIIAVNMNGTNMQDRNNGSD